MLLKFLLAFQNGLKVLDYVSCNLLEGHLSQHETEHIVEAMLISLIKSNVHHRKVEIEKVEAEEPCHKLVRILFLVTPVFILRLFDGQDLIHGSE